MVMRKSGGIIIITYNEEKSIGNLLKSIKRQNYKNYEIIVALFLLPIAEKVVLK